MISYRVKIIKKSDGYSIVYKHRLRTIAKFRITEELMSTFLLSNGLASYPGQQLPSDVLQRSLQILKDNLWQLQGFQE